MPTSRVIWYQNFFVRNQDYIGSIANAVASKGVVMGGPDVLPDNPRSRTRSYPFYTAVRREVCTSLSQVEDMCYRALHMTSGYRTKYWTMNGAFPLCARQSARELHVLGAHSTCEPRRFI